MTYCKQCEEELKRGACKVQCIVCKSKFHSDCVKIKEEHAKLISKYENMGLICNECKSNEVIRELKKVKDSLEGCVKSITNQNEIINRQNEIIEEHRKLLEKLSCIENPNAINKYTEICKKSHEKILIKPIEKQESKQTMDEVKEKVDPSNLQIGVQSVKNIKDGGIIINCADSQSKEKIKSNIEDLKTKYSIEEPKMKKPMIIVVDAEEEYVNMDNKEIEECLKKQNEILKTCEMKVVRKYLRKIKRNSGNLIIELDGNAYQQVIKMGTVNCAWRTCKAYEHVNILQCYNCGRYGHKAGKCQQKEATCFRCSKSDHHTRECAEEKLTCMNCYYAKETLKINVDYEHAAYDKKCPCYMKNVEREYDRTQI